MSAASATNEDPAESNPFGSSAEHVKDAVLETCSQLVPRISSQPIVVYRVRKICVDVSGFHSIDSTFTGTSSMVHA